MEDQIVTSNSIELADPKLREIANRLFSVIRLSGEKAVANVMEPEKYKLAEDEDSFEKIFQLRFKQLPKEKQEMAKIKIMKFVSQPEIIRQRTYKDLTKIDFNAPTPINLQAEKKELFSPKNMPSINFDDLRLIPHKLLTKKATLPIRDKQVILGDYNLFKDTIEFFPPKRLYPIPLKERFSRLALRLHKVKCLDETGSGWLGEAGDDEIYLGGTTVDETGDTKKISNFKVGNFNDNSTKVYDTPKTFAWFNITEGDEWPKSYFATFVLAEKDMGGLADFLNALLDKVKHHVISALTAAIGSAIGSSGGPVGAIIGLVVGYIVGKVFEWMKSWWSDDIFKPVTASITIPSPFHLFADDQKDSEDDTVSFKGHDGHYRLKYDWLLYN